MNLLAFADIRATEEVPHFEDIDLICLLGRIPSKIISVIENSMPIYQLSGY